MSMSKSRENYLTFIDKIKTMPYDCEKPLVSVIIPVYNVEQYLAKCLDSILIQDMKNYEVIIINDQSPDNCQQIIDEYCNKYQNFKCVFQKNSGQGVARNVGVKIAKADTVTFIDSDDYVAINFLSEMYCKMKYEDADFAYCDYYFVSENGKKSKSFPTFLDTADRNVFLPKAMADYVFHSYFWNKMYKKSLFINYEVYFPTEKIYFEDCATMVRLLFNAQKCVFVHKPLYYYLKRGGSDTSFYTYKSIQDHINAMAISRAYIDKYDFNNEFAFRKMVMHSLLKRVLPMDVCRIKESHSNKTVLKDIRNVWSQLKQFDNEKLPIKGEPWEKLVRDTVYCSEEIPTIKYTVNSTPRYSLNK